MPKRRLCALADLDATGARSLTVTLDGRPTDLFVVRRDGAVYAYVDRCPHAGTPLAWAEHEYLDEDGEHLICATHGALFDIATGACRGGPCRGAGLTPLPVVVEDDAVWLLA